MTTSQVTVLPSSSFTTRQRSITAKGSPSFSRHSTGESASLKREKVLATAQLSLAFTLFGDGRTGVEEGGMWVVPRLASRAGAYTGRHIPAAASSVSAAGGGAWAGCGLAGAFPEDHEAAG